MKLCPKCQRSYTDETLNFCLDDGTALLDGPGSMDEPSTAILTEFEVPSSGGVTSEDVTRVLEAERTKPSEEATRQPRSLDKRLLAAPVLLAVIVIGGFLGYRYFDTANSKQINSIAVLPFVNESGNPEIEYLSDGMTETLISSLSALPNLSVKARSSVFRYKGKDSDPKTVGRELNVQAILNGRVVQRGSDLILHVELVDAATENVLWKSDYQRTMSNLVALQNEIARDVSGKLRTKLSREQQKQVARNYTENAEAYRLYLQGRFHWNKRRADEHLRAIQYFEQAIALDPNYALAYAGIADCYAVSSSPLQGAERYNKLRAAATRALELDPTLGEPHAALATLGGEDWDWEFSEREYKKAIELNPNYATGHQWYAEMLTRLGRHDEAIAEIRLALELDPLSLIINSDAIYILSMARRYDEAIAQAKKTLEMDKTWKPARFQLIGAYLYKGRYEEALVEEETFNQYSDRTPEKKASESEEIAKVREAYRASGPEGYWRQILEFELADQARGSEFSPFFMAEVYAQLGDKEKAFNMLSKAIDEKEDGVDLAKVDPLLDNLRSDPRYAEILGRMRLPL